MKFDVEGAARGKTEPWPNRYARWSGGTLGMNAVAVPRNNGTMKKGCVFVLGILAGVVAFGCEAASKEEGAPRLVGTGPAGSDPPDASPTPAAEPDAGTDGGVGYGHVVYLNFSGARLDWDVTNDAALNRCWISKTHRNTSIPAFWEDDAFSAAHPTRTAVIDAIAVRVRDAFAPFDVQVVTERPALAAFTMVVVGGTMADVDIANVGAEGVSATRACTGATDRDLAFVATGIDRFRNYPDRVQAIANVIVHELGHTFGLVHNKNVEGTFMVTGGGEKWGSGPFDPVGSQDCGRTFQDDAATLRTNIGDRRTRLPVPRVSDAIVPSLEPVSLADGAALALNYRPCVSAEDASGVSMVMMQVVVQSPSGPVVVEQEALRAAPFRFSPLTRAYGPQTMLRFLAIDAFDNLTERRVIVTLGGAGSSSPTCD
jgi:hypothetical protein